MADFEFLIESAPHILGGWLEAFTANLEYQVALAVLIFITFGLWRPLLRRFWIKINGRRPGVQTHLPQEVKNHIKITRRCGKEACIWWAHAAFIYFTIAVSLGAYRQESNYYDFPSPTHTLLSALATGLFVWFATRALWECAPLWIEGKQKSWNKIQEVCRESGCGYYKGRDDWMGWAGWEIEDKALLRKRNAHLIEHIEYVESKKQRKKSDEELLQNRNKKAWKMLVGHQLEKSFWLSLMGKNLMKLRVPHIYQVGIQIHHRHYRYLDFALLDPKTGVPVLGIETDEEYHFSGSTPTKDLERELVIWESVKIPIYRIPGAYWLRGLAPGEPRLKENQKKFLDAALRERDRIIKEKRKRPWWQRLLHPLRRPP